VIVSAPADGADMTVVMAVNHLELTPEHRVISNAWRTNELPCSGGLRTATGHRHRAGYMTTIHAYTGDQNTVDTLRKDLRRARAASGAARSTT